MADRMLDRFKAVLYGIAFALLVYVLISAIVGNVIFWRNVGTFETRTHEIVVFLLWLAIFLCALISGYVIVKGVAERAKIEAVMDELEREREELNERKRFVSVPAQNTDPTKYLEIRTAGDEERVEVEFDIDTELLKKKWSEERMQLSYTQLELLKRRYAKIPELVGFIRNLQRPWERSWKADSKENWDKDKPLSYYREKVVA